MTGALPPPGAPAADVDITPDLVRQLLAAQHPDLAHLPLRAGLAGWDNAMLRLGNELVVRLPRRELAVPCMLNEQQWLPELASLATLPTPVPVRVGVPGFGYPYPWSVVPWIAGVPADERPLSPAGQAALARCLRAVHVAAPVDAPHNPYRGVPLADRTAAMAERLERVDASGVDVAVLSQRWDDGLAAPVASLRTWLHGDTHAGNVLVGGDGLPSGLIDWGDLGAGDPAVDVAAAWVVSDDAHAFLSAYGPLTPGLRERAAAWAAYFTALSFQADAPGETRHLTSARRALQRLGREG